jgi:tocopherol cyclase
MTRYFYNTLHPEIYHGNQARPPFFEGWYFKLVNREEDRRYAIIPGVILGHNAHAFVQVLDGVSGQTAYHTYLPEEFHSSPREFAIQVGPNSFTAGQIHLEIASGPLAVRGDITFMGVTPWPVSFISPGIMGWYAWAPRMECYHGVLGFDHAIQGSLAIDHEPVDFTDGRGYIEKDWGQSFPEAWVWFQSNHFEQSGACLTASVANIPWMGSAFRGFIVGFWNEGILLRFATYTGAQVDKLAISETHVDWVVSDRRHRLEMRAERAEGGLILGPTKLEMGKRVLETLNARIEVRLTHKSGELIFEGTGRHAGLEVHNTLALIG